MNLVVIGAGPAGEAAAKFAAKMKASVTLIEKDFVGGVCLNWGCIPSKTLLAYAKKIRDQKNLAQSGITVRLGLPSSRRDFLWREMRKQKDLVIEKLREDDEKSISLSGAKILKGQAQFASKKSLEIITKDGGQTLEFDKAVIATGSVPVFPPPLDFHQRDILDSDRIFDLEKIPENMLIVGGGAVGCEFACLLHEIGVQATIVEKTDGLLPGEDPQIVNVLTKSFEERGIVVKHSVTVEKIEKVFKGWKAVLSDGFELETAQILVCVGRKPRIQGLGLDKASVG